MKKIQKSKIHNRKNNLKEDLLIKEERISYWEKFGIVPSTNDIISRNNTLFFDSLNQGLTL